MKLIYYSVFFLWYLLSLLPLRVLYVVSDALFYPLYYIIRYRRRIVRRNLETSFPDKSPEEIGRIERGFYHFFVDYVMETLKLFSMPKGQMRRRMTFGGLDTLQEELRQEGKKTCFVFLGHYCNWEYVASLPGWVPGLHCGQIYHPLYNPAFDRLFLRLRSQFGGECIPMKETLRRLLALSREDTTSVIGFIADQAPKWEAMDHWTTFLHHDTSFFMGLERIARKVDAAVYYLEVKRVRRGYYHAEFQRMTLHPRETAEGALTDEYARRLERQIQEAPDCWLWSHNRWKRTKEEWEQRRKQPKEGGNAV